MDIHNLSARVARYKERLKRFENGKTASSFLDHLKIKGLSDARLWFYAPKVGNVVKYFDEKRIRLEEADRKDVEEFMSYILSRPYKAWTKQAYALTVKKLIAYVKTGDSDNYPPEVSWIVPHKYGKDAEKESRARPETLLTEEEIMVLIAATTNKRDRAMLWVLFEGALRPAELLTMKISSVEFKDKYCLISVHGKTGLKRIPLIYSYRPLLEWLNEHPMKNDLNAPLWLSSKGLGISYFYVRSLLKGLAKKAGIKKDVWPYLFRHTQLTRMAKGLTEAKLSLFAGWIQGSKMAPQIRPLLS